MLTVHHLGVSQSDRIVWLCEELEIPYQLQRYDRDPVSSLAPPAYRALHPFGTAPVITEGTLVLGESGAIIEYIIAKHGRGRLALTVDHPNFADYLFWYHFANGSMMPSLMVDGVISLLGIEAENKTAQALRSRTLRALEIVDQRLRDNSYFAGSEFSAADIMMLFPLTTMRNFAKRDISPYLNMRAYLKRIAARPALQRAMAKGDPGMALLVD